MGWNSRVLDASTRRLAREELLRRDVETYRRVPPTGEEATVASLGEHADLDDDTDWEALYQD